MNTEEILNNILQLHGVDVITIKFTEDGVEVLKQIPLKKDDISLNLSGNI